MKATSSIIPPPPTDRPFLASGNVCGEVGAFGYVAHFCGRVEFSLGGLLIWSRSRLAVQRDLTETVVFHEWREAPKNPPMATIRDDYPDYIEEVDYSTGGGW